MRVQGKSKWLTVPIVLLTATLGIGLYKYGVSPGRALSDETLLIMLGLLAAVIGLVLASCFLQSRYLILQGDQLRYVSWFSSRAYDLRTLTDLTFQEESSINTDTYSPPSHYLTFWDRNGVLLRLDIDYWEKEQLKLLVRMLAARYAGITIDREVRDYAAR